MTTPERHRLGLQLMLASLLSFFLVAVFGGTGALESDFDTTLALQLLTSGNIASHLTFFFLIECIAIACLVIGVVSGVAGMLCWAWPERKKLKQNSETADSRLESNRQPTHC